MPNREQNLKKTLKSIERQLSQPDCPECIKNMAKVFGIKTPNKKK